MEGRRRREEGELAALPPDSHMDSGSLGTNWLKVSLSVLLLRAVCKWLSGLLLCSVSRVIYQVCREETGGVGGVEEVVVEWEGGGQLQ